MCLKDNLIEHAFRDLLIKAMRYINTTENLSFDVGGAYVQKRNRFKPEDKIAAGVWTLFTDKTEAISVKNADEYETGNEKDNKRYRILTICHEIGHHHCYRNNIENDEINADRFIVQFAFENLDTFKFLSLKCYLSGYGEDKKLFDEYEKTIDKKLVLQQYKKYYNLK